MDQHHLTNEPASLNFVMNNESVFVNLKVCSSPVTAVCDVGASVSCSSQWFLKRFPVNFQNQLQPAYRQLSAANQAETPVSGTVTLPTSLASNRYQQQLFVLKSSEAGCLLGVDFFEDNHCDAPFSSMQLRFPNSQTFPLFQSCKVLSDASVEQVKAIARETTFIPSCHEALILVEPLTQSFPEKSDGDFQASHAFCEKYQFMTFNSL